MDHYNLKKLLKKKQRRILTNFMEQVEGSIGLYDTDGELFFGDAVEKAEYCLPIAMDKSTIAWMRAENEVQAIGELVQHFMVSELEKRDLIRDSLEKYKELSLLYSLAEQLTSKWDLKEIAELVLLEAQKVIVSDNASVMLLDEKSGETRVLYAGGDEQHNKTVFKFGEGIAGAVIQSGQAEIVNRVVDDPRFKQGTHEIYSLICAPLKSKERTFGVINLSSADKIHYSSVELKLLDTIALQASAAMENVISHQQKVKEEQIKANLQRYVSPQLAQAVMESIDDSPLQPVSQNVVSLFSDIRNFTTTCEQLKPQELVGHLNDYLNQMVNIIFEHEGTVDKFFGDMIVAMFGAPFEIQEKGKRALQTAIAMQKSLQESSDDWIKDHFQTGIGLNCGEVVVGNIGATQHMDYTAIGDSVNIASRLQSLAKKGEILVSRNVYDMVKDHFEFNVIGDVTVKGKSQLIEVYKVLY